MHWPAADRSLQQWSRWKQPFGGKGHSATVEPEPANSNVSTGSRSLMTCTKLADPYPNPILVQIEPMQCKSPIKISWICSCEKSSETGFFLLLLLFPLPDVASDSRAGGSCCPHPPKDIESNTPTLKIAPVPCRAARMSILLTAKSHYL